MLPKISVIIAAYNEEKLLPRCLKSLKNQTYPAEKFEVIVIDNGSKDDTGKIAKEFGVRVYRYTEIQGCGASRNFGVQQAEGEIIAFTDSDAIAFPDWLENIDKLFKDPEIVFVGGPAYPTNKSVWNTCLFKTYHWFDQFHAIIKRPLMGGYNMAVRKKAYEEVGGIDSSLKSSDDWDLSLRLRKKFGVKSILFSFAVKTYVSTRKQDKMGVFVPYFKDQVVNYYNMVLRGKSQATSLTNIR